jgi:hypothetical protein
MALWRSLVAKLRERGYGASRESSAFLALERLPSPPVNERMAHVDDLSSAGRDRHAISAPRSPLLMTA